jgi:hypothetical protein
MAKLVLPFFRYSPEHELWERIRLLQAQLDDVPPNAPEYVRLSGEIDELSRVYGALIEAKVGVFRPRVT